MTRLDTDITHDVNIRWKYENSGTLKKPHVRRYPFSVETHTKELTPGRIPPLAYAAHQQLLRLSLQPSVAVTLHSTAQSPPSLSTPLPESSPTLHSLPRVLSHSPLSAQSPLPLSTLCPESSPTLPGCLQSGITGSPAPVSRRHHSQHPRSRRD